MIPGEILVRDGDIELNRDRDTVTLIVANTGDRPIQVGSHYHFAETNAALAFDRAAARGRRLNIAAGTAVRFEPGQKRTVELVFETISSSLKGVKGGGRLQIGTFGTFVTSKRAARMGRNPRTGEAIKIKASKSLRFKPSAQLKKAAGC